MWESRINSIKESKSKILNELGFFPNIDKIINLNNTFCYIGGCVKNNGKYLVNVFDNIKKIIKSSIEFLAEQIFSHLYV